MSGTIKFIADVSPQSPFFAFFLAACDTAPRGTSGCPISISISSSSPLALAPIIAPVLIGFALLAVVGYYGWRRFRRTNSSLTVRLLETEFEVMQYRKAWHIAGDEMQMLECIGHGAVGEVFKGKWRGMMVAVKTVKGAWMSSEEMEQELDHEATVLQAVRHAQVVQFFGMGTLNNGMPFMVVELMELGTR